MSYVLFIDEANVASSDADRAVLSSVVPCDYAATMAAGLDHLASRGHALVLLTVPALSQNLADRCARIATADPSGLSHVVLLIPHALAVHTNIVVPHVVGLSTYSGDWQADVRRLGFLSCLATSLDHAAQETGTANDHGAVALARRITACTSGSILLVRIDNYAELCRSVGFGVCSRLVEKVRTAIAGCLRMSDEVMLAQPRSDDVVYLGGADVLVILERMADSGSLRKLRQRIQSALHLPLHVEALSVPAHCLIGHASWSSRETAAEELLHMAVVDAERSHGGLSSATQELSRAALQMEADLYDAIRNDELLLYFQPKFRLDDSAAIVGAEALLRWRRKGTEWVPPDVFIPIAEANGLIVPIGRWVIEEAVRCQRGWRDAGLGLLQVSVNVSAQQFLQLDFVEHLKLTCEAAGVPPGALEIEITESCLIDRPEAVIRVLEEIRSVGYPIALDDFGTGYSSLSYLRSLPLDALKIDRSFVQCLDGDEYDPALTAGIIGLGLVLGLRVVAEGIETETQWHCMQEWGCHHGQGYLMSRPVPFAELSKMLHGGTVAFAS